MLGKQYCTYNIFKLYNALKKKDLENTRSQFGIHCARIYSRGVNNFVTMC